VDGEEEWRKSFAKSVLKPIVKRPVIGQVIAVNPAVVLDDVNVAVEAEAMSFHL
jgi:hypothetical protein